MTIPPPADRPTAAELKIGSSANSPTVVCPQCGSPKLFVYKTIEQTSQTLRYERCIHCGKRVITKQPKTAKQILREVDAREDSSAGMDSLTFPRVVA